MSVFIRLVIRWRQTGWQAIRLLLKESLHFKRVQLEPYLQRNVVVCDFGCWEIKIAVSITDSVHSDNWYDRKCEGRLQATADEMY